MSRHPTARRGHHRLAAARLIPLGALAAGFGLASSAFGQAAPALMQDAQSGRWSIGTVEDAEIAQRDDFAATLPMLTVRRPLALDPQQLREAVLL